MHRKGRIRVGADADITIFDPQTVSDRASYSEPTLPSAGIRYVVVAGVPIVADGAIADGVFPGTPIRGSRTESTTAAEWSARHPEIHRDDIRGRLPRHESCSDWS